MILSRPLIMRKSKKKCSKSKKKEDLTDPVNITITNFKISSEGNDLFINGRFLIADGKRYGLVGLENYGKTALLKHIANIPSGIDVLYWDQGIVDETLSATNAVVKPSTRCSELLAEREKLIAELDNNINDSDEVVNNRYSRLEELWEDLLMIDPEEHPAKGKATTILCGLGLPLHDIEDSVINLPEHLRKRVSLARALYLEPTLLILEEPTTELDLDSVIWLENYLQDWTKTLIIVSQDRCFLDNVCKEIIQVNLQQFCYYEGNYSFFEKKFHQKQRKNLKKKEKKLQFEAKGKSRDAGVKSQAMTKSRSRNGRKMLDSGEGTPPVQPLQKPEFRFLDPIIDRNRIILLLSNITFAYGKKNPLFESLHLKMTCEKRIAILGPSRAGKTTLLKLASNELEAQKGKFYLEDGATIGKFSQSAINDLPSAENPLEYLSRKAVDEKSFKQKAVDQLISLGLPSRLHTTKIQELTTDQKARVVLAELCLFPHDGLILDEPERNMDIMLIDALADAINVYKGGIVLVTNNQYLIRETESDLYRIKNRKLIDIDDFEKYRRKVLTKLGEPIRGPFIFKKRTELRREISPAREESDSEIILNYIKNNDNVDPTIKNIGEYRIIFSEGTTGWTGESPTLYVPMSFGKTKELCRKNTMYAIEEYIEHLIKHGEEVPRPP